MLLNGNGVDEDPAQAAEWFAKAADQGMAESQLTMGDLHAKGHGVVQDNELARYWYEKAASQGNEEAAAKLARLDGADAAEGEIVTLGFLEGPDLMPAAIAEDDNAPPAEPQHEETAVGEPVRLVIWDLDDTFWTGTLSEGGIRAYSEANQDAVIALARRGILSAICSKNDLAPARQVLEQHGLWDYFVFPSIDWAPKAGRVAAIIESAELRVESVLFVDDHPANRAEVTAHLPGIQVADATILPTLLADPRLAGKDDSSLTRLAQYKLLERRNADRQTFEGDNEAFLRASGIRVIIDNDVKENLDRAIELINRTNQLNYTKRRLPDDIDEARAQLVSEISPYYVRADLIRVVDDYGDYGYCGFYRSIGSTLLDFCFSCRVIGIGVETWLYEHLGRPRLHVSGEVVTDLSQPKTVDWITPITTNEPDGERTTPFIPAVRMRGGCVLEALAHYFGLVAGSVTAEINDYRAPIVLHADSSAQLLLSFGEAPARTYGALQQLEYAQGDLASDFLAPAAPGSVLIYAAWADVSMPVYRHKTDGFAVPVDVDIYQDLTRIGRDALAEALGNLTVDEADKERIKSLITVLRATYDYEPTLPIDAALEILQKLFERVPDGARLLVILPHERMKWNETLVPRPVAIEYNKAVRALALGYPFVTLIEMNDVVAGPQDVQTEYDLFDRIVYFRLFQRIIGEIAAKPAGALQRTTQCLSAVEA